MPPSTDSQRISAEQLDALEPIRVIPGRNASKADIRVYRLAEETLAVKDYGHRPFLIRHLVGRLMLRRESHAYGVAAGIDGLPEFLGRIGRFALATRWLEAKPLAECPAQRIPADCLEQVDAIVAKLHGRGIALTDMHHRDILIGVDGRVWIVDLASAWVGATGWRRPIFRWLRQLDILSLWRLKRRVEPATADRPPPQVSPSILAWHRRGRRMKGILDRFRGRQRT
jgi:hypothetical protein